MSSTTFVNRQTPITAEWLNDVNAVVYGSGTYGLTYYPSHLQVGGVPMVDDKISLMVDKASTDTSEFVGVQSSGVINPTTSVYQFLSYSNQAAGTAVTSASHFHAVQGSFGAGATLTKQYGYVAHSSMTGATYNYGFYGSLSSGTGRWNLYMAGTAANYMAGVLGIGAVASDGLRLDVKQTSGAAGTDVATSFVRRTANHTGGTAGFVSAAHRVETVVSAGATNFEWAHVAVITNAATAGENVASYAQGNKTSTGPTWAAVAEAIDTTSTANPTTGLVALEVDVRANGTDTNNNRLGIDIVATRQLVAGSPSGAAMVASYGVRLQNAGDASAQFTVGFDTSAATIGQAAFKMAQDQAIAFNSTATRQLSNNGSSFIFKNNSGTTYWSLNDDRSLVVQGTQILGSRATGWAAATGTATRTTFATTTVTTEQLAQRVKALIDDLTTHGLIGT